MRIAQGNDVIYSGEKYTKISEKQLSDYFGIGEYVLKSTAYWKHCH